MNRFNMRSAWFAGCAAIAVSAPVAAQEAVEEPENVIVVTAQNREQNVQDVPCRSTRIRAR
jgi:outer membrane receptor for ferrienterochelin and colicin